MITQRRPVAYTPRRIALVVLLTAMVLLLASCETDDGAWEDDAPLEQEVVQAEAENLDEEDAELTELDVFLVDGAEHGAVARPAA